jgi:hypothetical protein
MAGSGVHLDGFSLQFQPAKGGEGRAVINRAWEYFSRASFPDVWS